MKPAIKAISTRIMATLLHPLVLKLFHRGRLTILMYHGVIDRPMVMPDPCMIYIDKFRSQMRHLKKHFNVISLTRAVDLLRRGAVTDPLIVITFDDGYQNNFDLAYPILREENLPATIFLATSFVDTDTTVWTGILHNAFTLSSKTHFEWRNQHFDLGTLEQKQKSLGAVKTLLKDTPYQLLADDVNEIVMKLSEEDPISLDPDSPYRILNSASIEKLTKSNLIELGAHTHNHFILSNMPASTQEAEIRQSLELVKSLSGQPCTLFAYPNGMKNDYDQDSLSILAKNGVVAALTTEPGICSADTPILELQRIGVSADADISSFKLSLFNMQVKIRRLLRFNISNNLGNNA